jgi:hypothetical protein
MVSGCQQSLPNLHPRQPQMLQRLRADNLESILLIREIIGSVLYELKKHSKKEISLALFNSWN